MSHGNSAKEHAEAESLQMRDLAVRPMKNYLDASAVSELLSCLKLIAFSQSRLENLSMSGW